MTKYVFSYHGGGGMPETEAEQAELMQAWGAWFESLGSAVVDGGNPIGETRTVGADGSIAEGGGANPVNGYGLFEAADLAAALDMAKGCPVLTGGGSVEVGEAIEM